MSLRKTLHISTILLALATAFGVVLHDTQSDHATSLALGVPVMIGTAQALSGAGVKQSDPHVHVERTSVGNALATMRAHAARLPSRGDSDRKYALGKKVMRGHHAFDNYTLPIV